MYSYTRQCRNSTYMKFNPQATLKWAAQRMHSKVIRLVMQNANIKTTFFFMEIYGAVQCLAKHIGL